MATVTAKIPRVSKLVQEQLVTRIPARQVRRRIRNARKNRGIRPTRRVIVLTAVSLAAASAATATAFLLARRFTSCALEDPDGQAVAATTLEDVTMPDRVEEGATELAIEEFTVPLA